VKSYYQHYKSDPLKIVILVCTLLFLSISMVSCQASRKNQPKVENGVIDLRSWDFEKSGPVNLNGDWKFIWKHLILPQNRELITDHLYVPKNWVETTQSGVSIGPEGFGTYSLIFRLSKLDQPVAFYLPIMAHASSIWINGKHMYRAGQVSDNKETMVPGISRDVVVVNTPAESLELIIQVSNFVHNAGGIETSFLFGLKDQITEARTRNIFIEAFLSGSLVLAAILYFLLALLFLKRRAALLFAAICFDIALRGMLTGEQLLYTLFPTLSWELEYKLEYLTAFSLAVPLIALFIYDLFPHPKSKHFLTAIFGTSFLCGLFIILTPVHTFSGFLLEFEILLLLQAIYIAFLLITAIINRLQGSGILFSGGIILLLTAISDIMFYQQLIDIGPLAAIGFWFFLLSQAFAFTIQFKTNFKKLMQISSNLEWQVGERTRNLSKANEKLKEEIKNKEEIEKKLLTISRTDPLTGIDNRYRFNETLDEEISRVNRYGGALSVIMFDIDHFKLVNDTFGHDVGDRVLVNIAHLVENMIRDIDSFARWGGEEFIILTPNNDIDGATLLAERIRRTIELNDFTPVKTLTSSFGVIQYNKNEEKTSFFKRVDEALYAAKYQGRNRVVSLPDEK